MEMFFSIFILAMTVEAVVEYGKLLFMQKKIVVSQVFALLFGVALSLLANTNLYRMVGIVFKYHIVGNVLTGVLFSRGANYMSDFVSRLPLAKKEDPIRETKEFDGMV